jgi:hypothetical protein
MGTNTLVSKSDGQTISSSDVNQYRTALNQNIVPRNASGAPTDQAGDLGTSTYGFDKVYAEEYNIGDTASGLVIKENVSGQMSFQSSGVERVVLDDNGINGSGIKDSTIATSKIIDANITTAKIADSNVTTAKIADSNVTSAKIASTAVTTAKIANSAVSTNQIADLSISNGKIINGAVTVLKRSVDSTASSSSGTWSTSSLTETQINNAFVFLSPDSRPLKIELLPDYTTNISQLYLASPTTPGAYTASFCLYRATTKIDEIYMYSLNSTTNVASWPSVCFYTGNESGINVSYGIQVKVSSANAVIHANNMRVVATYI